MNWGWKIVLLYSGFVVMTLAMVFYFMGHKVDLVADDYYKQELKYQEQIDKLSNTQALDQALAITLDRPTMTMSLIFPEVHVSAGMQGTIHFYRPANGDEDKTIPLQTDSAGVQIVPVSTFSKGLWKVKVSWKSQGIDYYDEKTITL